MTLEEILAQVQMGGLSPEAAGKLIRQDGYKEWIMPSWIWGEKPVLVSQR